MLHAKCAAVEQLHGEQGPIVPNAGIDHIELSIGQGVDSDDGTVGEDDLVKQRGRRPQHDELSQGQARIH